MASDRRPRDVNQLAARIVAEATGQVERTEPVARPAKVRKPRAGEPKKKG